MIESASKREKQIQIEFDVIPAAQVNFGKPLKIDVETPNERVTFAISTSIPEIDLSQYSVSLGTGCLDEIVVKSRSAKELTVEAKVAQIKENENVLSKTCTIRLKSENPKSKAIPDLRLVVEYVGKVRFFPSQAIFHDKESDFRAVLLIESNSFSFERESLDFRILRDSKLVTTAKVIASQELTSNRWSFRLSLERGQNLAECDILEVWNGNEFVGRLPFRLLELR